MKNEQIIQFKLIKYNKMFIITILFKLSLNIRQFKENIQAK